MANRYNTNKLSFWGAYTGSVELGKKFVNMHIHIKNEMICIVANMALIISRMNIDNLRGSTGQKKIFTKKFTVPTYFRIIGSNFG